MTGRGCSTKRAGYVACETHSYGPDTSDKFCYCRWPVIGWRPAPARLWLVPCCSKPLCNAARGAGVGSPLVLASCLIITLALSSWPGLALGIQAGRYSSKKISHIKSKFLPLKLLKFSTPWKNIHLGFRTRHRGGSGGEGWYQWLQIGQQVKTLECIENNVLVQILLLSTVTFQA